MTRTIVHVIGSLNRGGAESVALDLCRAIAPAELQQVFVCLSGELGELAPAFSAAGATPVALRGGLLRKVCGLARVLIVERPDIVQSHVALASGWVLWFAKVLRVPVRVARLHSEGDGRPDTRMRRAYRQASRRMARIGATHVLSVTSAAERFAVGGPAAAWRAIGLDVRVVPNGVDLTRFKPANETLAHETPVVLHVGRADPAKNRAALGPIAREVKRQRLCEVWLVGTDSTDDLGEASDEFVIKGARADIDDVYRAGDVLVLPSVREGLPGVVLEALATGLPVVASDLAGLRQLADRLKGISLVPIDAGPQAWAAEVLEALSTPESARREIVICIADSDYNLTNNVNQWRSIWGLESYPTSVT